MPNHREPVTVKMVLHMCKKCANNYPDSIECILCNWIVIGIFYGFDLSEWAQNASDKTQHLTGPNDLPIAFILPNTTFLRVKRTTIPRSWSAQLHDINI